MKTVRDIVIDYWLRYYIDATLVNATVCTLCGNYGVIDTRGINSPTRKDVGRLNYCICPNGQALRTHDADMAEIITIARKAT